MPAEPAAVVTALWLGILTSISPCPLATNVAAVSWLARHVGRPRLALGAGALYTAGRMLVYVVLGAAAVWGLMSAFKLSGFLQGTFARLIGPLLIAVGLLLLGVLHFSTPGSGVSDRVIRRAERSGLWGAGLMGVVFALSFCPVSAGLFFVTLIPLAAERGSPLLLPSLYGVGTALPVAAFAVLLAAGVGWLGTALNRLQAVERWVRRATGVVFIMVGIYETLRTSLQVL
jgi:cytochrome c biogenesis protein CcdA